MSKLIGENVPVEAAYKRKQTIQGGADNRKRRGTMIPQKSNKYEKAIDLSAEGHSHEFNSDDDGLSEMNDHIGKNSPSKGGGLLR